MRKLLLITLLTLCSFNVSAKIWPQTNAEARAMKAATCAIKKGLSAPSLVVVIDMAQNRNEKRLKAFDLSTGQVILQDYVAHGRGSGSEANTFSNKPGSLATSVGLYKTGERYYNTEAKEWRRRLDGLTPGLNDRARERAIVLHSAAYVRPGAVGRSEGCPAVRSETLQALERAGLDDALIWIDSEKEASELEASMDCEDSNPTIFNSWNPYLLTCPTPTNFNVGGWFNV